jgi:malate dehydrogenase (oxaloacetate-decarboxylating)(NADP+)
MIRTPDALAYHADGRRGKIEVVPTKPVATQRDLSLAYSPGVAEPCRAIARDPELVYRYTAKGNLVAVVTDGSAVLGLGRIGPAAAKPVMEGKAVLFKKFADIDVFDLEVQAADPEEFIAAVAALEPTFGGINLEDIRSPECFEIERRLQERMSIPVFHDDQHGTAIISGAALLNAIELAGKSLDAIRVVFAGAGAAAVACARLYVSLGVRPENVLMCDEHGVLREGRDAPVNPYNAPFVRRTSAFTLAEALVGADILVGLSVGGIVTPGMLAGMAPDPIVFAMANPDPEIGYPEARAARPDVIMATGRSDFPNQVNNVLGFPFIFRGALDVRARAINEEMKIAAVHALAELAREGVPDTVARAYGNQSFRFGREYILPKPFDHRVLLWVAPAVARAAMETGVARQRIDLVAYRDQLEASLGRSREVMRGVIAKAQRAPKRIVFPEGEHERILKASEIVRDEGIAKPILLGNPERIRARIAELGLDLEGCPVIWPREAPERERYARVLFEKRQRRGMTASEAFEILRDPGYFGTMMVELGDADGLLSGIDHHYAETIRPALQIVGMDDETRRISGLYLIILKRGLYFFADTTVNIEPSAEDLAEIALLTARTARRFEVEPRVAMLSFSNFGSSQHPLAEKVRRATELLRERATDLVADGEMQVDLALVPEIVEQTYPFSALRGEANVLIFPCLEAGNIAYQLMQRLGGADKVGPILQGMRKPVHVLQRNADVNDVVNMAAIAVVEAQG